MENYNAVSVDNWSPVLWLTW